MNRFLWPLVGFIVVAAVAAALFALIALGVDEGAPRDLAGAGPAGPLMLAKDAMPLGMSESFIEEKRRARLDDDLIAQF